MSNVNPSIRIARVADAQPLASMHVQSWRETYSGILPDSMLAALSVEGRADGWVKILREPISSEATVVYLAEVSGVIAGFGSCGAQRTDSLKAQGFDGEISAIYVLRQFQSNGIGVKLLRKMASELMRRGIPSMSLWVLRDNQVARKFYERHGAQVIDEREDVRGDAVLVEIAYGWRDVSSV